MTQARSQNRQVKIFFYFCVGYFAKNESSTLINFVCKSRNGEQLLITFLTEIHDISQLINWWKAPIIFSCKNEILSRARSHNLMIDVSWGERGSLECQDLRDFQWFLRSHGYSIDNARGFIDLEFELLFKKEAFDSKERYYLFHWYWINLQLVWVSPKRHYQLSKELWLSNLAAIYCSFVKLIFGHRHCDSDIFLEKVQLCNKK